MVLSQSNDYINLLSSFPIEETKGYCKYKAMVVVLTGLLYILFKQHYPFFFHFKAYVICIWEAAVQDVCYDTEMAETRNLQL